jgi:succinate dehydrogenase/fumarate reductase flavoprotein subunit
VEPRGWCHAPKDGHGGFTGKGKNMEKKVIIIGAGLAGLTAAYAAQAEGAEVLLIDKGPIGLGTNTALANGVFACPTSGYEAEAYVEDTLQVGRRINYVKYVKHIAWEAPGALGLLKSLGLNFKERRGLLEVPVTHPQEIPGRILVKTLTEKVLALNRIKVLRNFYVTELVREERIKGLWGFDETGEEIFLPGSAVILATGGAGAIYRRNDNQRSTMGQGYALAAQAGLSLWDMEFIQFYPLVLNESRLPSIIVYPPYPNELKVINGAGEDLLEKWQMGNINTASMSKRDAFSLSLFEEGLKGGTYLDCRQLSEPTREAQLGALFKKVRFDFRQQPVAVSPAAHFFMGGIRVNEQARTELPGLFACGEIVWGFHGANRRGGNALTECAVMGLLAGKQAAEENQLMGSPPSSKRTVAGYGGEIKAAPLRELRDKLRETTWNCAGVIRTSPGIEQGLKEINEIQARLEGMSPYSVEERKQKADLLAGCLVTRAILTASRARQESRGSFMRREFPGEDDAKWLKNSCLTLDSDGCGFTLSHEEVEQ